MSTVRQNKVNALLKRELSIFFQREARTIGQGGMVSVTTVRVSPDMSVERIYLSIFAVKDPAAVVEAIKAESSTVRNFLGKELGKSLRIIPSVMFFLDDSLDYAEKIDDLLK